MESMMTDTKFTPGPWTNHGSHIYAPDGAIIAQVHNPGTKESDYPLIANRDLMTAAPDLYAALETARLHLINDLDEPVRTVFWKIVSAQQKARAAS